MVFPSLSRLTQKQYRETGHEYLNMLILKEHSTLQTSAVESSSLNNLRIYETANYAIPRTCLTSTLLSV